MEFITQEYTFNCLVKKVSVGYSDEQSKGISNQEEEMVFLVPCEGSSRDMFLARWLPDSEQYEYVDSQNNTHTEWAFSEIGFRIGHPIFGVFRGALRRYHPKCKEPHIMVMTKGVEEGLKRMHMRVVEVTSMSELKDEELDNQSGFELSLNKNI